MYTKPNKQVHKPRAHIYTCTKEEKRILTVSFGACSLTWADCPALDCGGTEHHGEARWSRAAYLRAAMNEERTLEREEVREREKEGVEAGSGTGKTMDPLKSHPCNPLPSGSTS